MERLEEEDRRPWPPTLLTRAKAPHLTLSSFLNCTINVGSKCIHVNIASMYICCARRHQHEHTKGPSQSSQCTQQEKLIDFPSTPALPLPPCPPLLRHAAESACVHREPRAPPPGGVLGFRRREPRGQNTVCAVPGPLSGAARPEAQTGPCSSSSSPFIPPTPATGLFRRGCGGRAQGLGASRRPSDFKDIGGHFWCCQKPHNSFYGCHRPSCPPHTKASLGLVTLEVC